MLKVGLTGGIGSGKTTVAERFRSHGVPVVDADAIAHELVEPATPAYTEIVSLFGRTVLDPNHRINRAALRQRIFDDPVARGRLEAILHPRIRQTMQQRCNQLRAPYCILVIPLLFETGQQDLVDRILVVDAGREQRLKWLMLRDGGEREQLEKIMDAQADRSVRLHGADDTIVNDGDLERLNRQVDRLHDFYLSLAGADTSRG